MSRNNPASQARHRQQLLTLMWGCVGRQVGRQSTVGSSAPGCTGAKGPSGGANVPYMQPSLWSYHASMQSAWLIGLHPCHCNTCLGCLLVHQREGVTGWSTYVHVVTQSSVYPAWSSPLEHCHISSITLPDASAAPRCNQDSSQ
jgi:hypothetical protein